MLRERVPSSFASEDAPQHTACKSMPQAHHSLAFNALLFVVPKTRRNKPNTHTHFYTTCHHERRMKQKQNPTRTHFYTKSTLVISHTCRGSSQLGPGTSPQNNSMGVGEHAHGQVRVRVPPHAAVLRVWISPQNHV